MPTKIQIIDRYKIAACTYISFANATPLLIRVENGLCKASCLNHEKVGYYGAGGYAENGTIQV